MAGLLQALRRTFTGTTTRPTPAIRVPEDEGDQREEYGLIGGDGGHEAGTELADRVETKPREVDDGVYVKPTPITSGQLVTVWYSGLLARHGADQVYLHYGFGPGRWQDVGDLPMKRVGWIGETPLWEAHVEAKGFGTFEFCFRDSADHWDSNSGHNWVYQIHWGARS